MSPLQEVLQTHTESLSSVFWLIRADHNETFAFGYISQFQSFTKQSESQKDPQLFQLRRTSETSSQKTLSDNHLGLTLEIRRSVCTLSPNTFPTSEGAKAQRYGGGITAEAEL